MERLGNPLGMLSGIFWLAFAVVGLRKGGRTAELAHAGLAGWASTSIASDLRWYHPFVRFLLRRAWRPEPRIAGSGTAALFPDPSRPGERFDKFTRSARRALSLAHEEAAGTRASQIGVEHLLLGTVLVEDSLAARALRSVGAEIETVRERVRRMAEEGGVTSVAEPGLTDPSKCTIERAFAEAR